MQFALVDIIGILIILAIVGGASFYIYREKKKGRACIGCPMAGDCQRKKAQAGACSCGDKSKK